MKKISTIVFMFLILTNLIAQNYISGKSGILLKSVDGGINWTTISAGSNRTVLGICKQDSRLWWTVEGTGSTTPNMLLYSDNVGVSFDTSIVNVSNSSNDYNEIGFFDNNTGVVFALNTSTSVGMFKTTDRGITWPTTVSNRGPNYGLQILNTTTAFHINNYNGTNIIKTTDQYLTSTSLFSSFDFNSIMPIGADTIIVIGNNGFVSVSIDKGTTWSKLSIPSIDSSIDLKRIAKSPDGYKIVITGTKNYVVVSMDRGKTWSKKTAIAGSTFTMNDAYYVNDTLLLVGGYDGTSSISIKLGRSTDGGNSFNEITDTVPGIDRRGYMTAFSFLDGNNGVAVINRGVTNSDYQIIRTKDGGLNWKRIEYSISKPQVHGFIAFNLLSFDTIIAMDRQTAGNAKIHKIIVINDTVKSSFINIKTGFELKRFVKKGFDTIYAPGLGGIYMSPNKGLSWIKINSLPSFSSTVQLNDYAEGFICGNFCEAYKSSNNINYTEIYPLGYKKSLLRDLSTIDENNIFAVGASGLVIYSSNGGVSWNFIGDNQKLSNYNFVSCDFLNSNKGYIIGNTGTYGVLAKTTNGGITWDLDTIANVILNEIDMLDEYNGIIVGNGGLILKTINGGLTWITITTSTTNDLLRVIYNDETVIKLNENSKKLQSIIYPNPSYDGRIIINAQVGSTIFVTNILGNMILKTVSNATTISLNLPDGLYIVNVNGYTEKVLIQ